VSSDDDDHPTTTTSSRRAKPSGNRRPIINKAGSLDADDAVEADDERVASSTASSLEQHHPLLADSDGARTQRPGVPQRQDAHEMELHALLDPRKKFETGKSS
jgi:hypothetical protein